MMVDVHDNKLTKMIMGQEYDTESANMVFEEEDIDWKIMNIKMTIDKTGKQHPSWIYTPLYTKDCMTVSQPLPTSVDQITVEQKTVTVHQETVVETIGVEGAVDVVDGGVVEASAEVEIPISNTEYDTISVNEEFDVELGDWKCNESFRLIFDPTGNVRPRIEFLVGQDIADEVPPPTKVVTEVPAATVDAEVPAATVEVEVPAATVEVEVPAATVDAEVPAATVDVEVPTATVDVEVPTATVVTEVATATVVTEVVTTTVVTESGSAVELPEVDYPTDDNEIVVSVTTGGVVVDGGDTPSIDQPETPSTVSIDDIGKQPDQFIGQVSVQVELLPTANISTGTTFILPDIRQFGRGLADFIKDELIDIHMLQVLTTNGGINWWSDIKGCCKLFPLWTLNKEGSLLNAINFAISGFNNYLSHLQSAMHQILTNPLINTSIKKRWSYDLWLKNSKSGTPIETSAELDKKWQSVIQGSLLDYLGAAAKGEVIQTNAIDIDPIHIYLLANLLCRPIVILSEVEDANKNNAESLLKGIYIPFEQEAEKCCHFPIILGYHRHHFTALVATDTRVNTLATNVNAPMWVPLTNAYLSLLPVHFATYPGADWEPYEILDPLQIPEVSEELIIDALVKYLQLVKVRFSKQTYNPPEDESNIPSPTEDDESKRFNYLTAVRTNLNRKPNDYKDMIKTYIGGAKKRHKSMKNKKVQCKSNGCKNIPSSQLGGVCVRCYQRTLLNHVESN